MSSAASLCIESTVVCFLDQELHILAGFSQENPLKLFLRECFHHLSCREAPPLHADPSFHCVVLLCCVVWLQVDSLEAVVELCGFLAALLPVLGSAAGERWRSERTRLLLHLLCLCELCLSAGGDCRPVVGLMLQLLPSCQPVGDLSFSFFFHKLLGGKILKP